MNKAGDIIMKKIAVFLADGFEEIEAIDVVDILRRGGFHCDCVSLQDRMVRGSHDVRIQADSIINDDINNYDMIVLPGGLPGATNLRDDQRVIEYVRQFAGDTSKYVAAICAAPIVLAKAGVINNRKVTSYPRDDIRAALKESGATVLEETVVVDGNIITSRGPATTFAFAYAIVDILGGDSKSSQEGMQYNFLKQTLR